MKQPGILLFYGIALVNIALSTAVDCTNGGMAVTRIEMFDIEISWNQTCFGGDTSYGIQITGDGSCTRNKYPCEENICKINIAGMGCGSNPIKPCSSYTYKITGDNNGNSFDISTTAAPYVTPNSWQLCNSSFDNTILNARWGPLENPTTDMVKCATRTKIEVSCIAHSNGTEIKISNVTDVDPAVQGELDLQIHECEDGSMNMTAIYMSENVETESKGYLAKEYTAPPLISCYECFANKTNCYNDFEDLVPEEKFISCYWKNVEGDADERGGLFISHNEGWNGNTYYCSSDLCNAASTNSVTMTLLAIVPLFLQFLLQ